MTNDNSQLESAALSDGEITALLECEALIRDGHKTALEIYVRIGRALKRIRDERLYRARHKTFEVYCDQEWGMSAHHARNNIRAMEVYLTLEDKKFHLLPTSESQARPMTELPPAEWGSAWEEVTGTAPNGKVTAKHVRAVVERRMNRLAGVSTDTDRLEKSKVAEPALPGAVLSLVRLPPMQPTRPENVIDVEVLSTREKRIRALAREALAKMIELSDAIGTGDITASKVAGAIQDLDELQTHYSRKEEMFESRKAGV